MRWYVRTVVLKFIRKEWRNDIMAEQEIVLLKGNEAIAHAAIRCGADASVIRLPRRVKS